MTDLDLLVAGAVVTFLAVAGAYIAIRHRANETPVDSYRPVDDRVPAETSATVTTYVTGENHVQAPALAQPHIDASN
jgi:hypothetical protein